MLNFLRLVFGIRYALCSAWSEFIQRTSNTNILRFSIAVTSIYDCWACRTYSIDEHASNGDTLFRTVCKSSLDTLDQSNIVLSRLVAFGRYELVTRQVSPVYQFDFKA